MIFTFCPRICNLSCRMRSTNDAILDTNKMCTRKQASSNKNTTTTTTEK